MQFFVHQGPYSGRVPRQDLGRTGAADWADLSMLQKILRACESELEGEQKGPTDKKAISEVESEILTIFLAAGATKNFEKKAKREAAPAANLITA